VKDGIIAGVTGWHAALLALPLWFAPPAGAAEDLQSAAKELGRKTAFVAGREPVAVSWRNLSSLGSAALAQARGSFEAALRESGARTGEAVAVEAQVTLSENAATYLLVEELRKGDDRQVWIASWRRGGGPTSGPAAAIEKRLLWEQEEPILDVAVLHEGLLVLTPTALLRTAPRQSAPIVDHGTWPRDVRGRLRINGGAVQAHLPGVSCSGSIEPLTLSCKASDEPWTLESGRALLLASFAANRNYFDGRVVTQAGLRKTVGGFYSAAAVDGAWILAMLDGRAALFDAAMEPAGTAGQWGSDVAASEARCGGSPVVLASRGGDGPDAVQAYAIANRSAVAIGAPVEFGGPVTALWTPGIAVAREGTIYRAYLLAVTCGQ
jgi:hypothetical protein